MARYPSAASFQHTAFSDEASRVPALAHNTGPMAQILVRAESQVQLEELLLALDGAVRTYGSAREFAEDHVRVNDR